MSTKETQPFIDYSKISFDQRYKVKQLCNCLSFYIPENVTASERDLENAALFCENSAKGLPRGIDYFKICSWLKAMPTISVRDLMGVMPDLDQHLAEKYLPFLNYSLELGNINTRCRQAAYLAQIAHETYQLRRWLERASGDHYEGKSNIGNIQPGDGSRFKGRGPLQLTGRDNYTRAGKWMKTDLHEDPDLVLDPEIGFKSAAWFWAKNRDLNKFCDCSEEGFREITRAINPGLEGEDKRLKFFRKAKEVLKADQKTDN